MDSSVLPTSGVSPEEQIDVDDLVAKFILLRDRKRLMEKQHKDSLKPFADVMDEIGGKLLHHMEKTGATSLSTKSGSAYQTTKRSATIKDGTMFRDFIVDNAAFDLVDWRANATAVFDYIKQNKGVPPPGVSASSFTTIGVRRPNETAED